MAICPDHFSNIKGIFLWFKRSYIGAATLVNEHWKLSVVWFKKIKVLVRMLYPARFFFSHGRGSWRPCSDIKNSLLCSVTNQQADHFFVKVYTHFLCCKKEVVTWIKFMASYQLGFHDQVESDLVVFEIYSFEL